jgi:hypothetical protein
METFTAGQVWAALLAVASAIVLLSNAAKAIAQAWQAAKAPNAAQDARIDALEAWKVEVDRKLGNDKKQLEEIHEGLRASYQAQLALLDHGIDGNNIKQMQDAKEVLQKHLINR